MGTVIRTGITTNTSTILHPNCQPSVFNLKNEGVGSVTVQVFMGTLDILMPYTPTTTTLSAGQSVQCAVAEPYQTASIVTTNNSGALTINASSNGFNGGV